MKRNGLNDKRLNGIFEVIKLKSVKNNLKKKIHEITSIVCLTMYLAIINGYKYL